MQTDRVKIRAGWAVKSAVRRGKFPPAWAQVCEVCQEAQAKNYYHHKGYSKEFRLHVMAVCVDCHIALHPVSQEQIEKYKETRRKKGKFNHTEETKLRIGDESRNRIRTEETRLKTKQSLLRWWKENRHKRKLLPTGCETCKTKPFAKGMCSVCYQRHSRQNKKRA